MMNPHRPNSEESRAAIFLRSDSHSARGRNAMIARFQTFDEDGDGKVTEAEITIHADKTGTHMQDYSAGMQMSHNGQMHNSAPEYK